ncbi:MAG: hypothetical protein JO057_26455 [Chloroflexi bacterium]|nr:hypothetical protein [Chloroflexota bacterium]
MLTAMEPLRVRVQVASCQPAAEAGHWEVTWLVHNDADEPVQLEDAWIPHGRFRGPGHVRLSVRIEPRTAGRVHSSVAADEPAGTIVRNAFLILRASCGQARWRIFARMRVEFGPGGRAWPVLENVSLQCVE